MRICLDLRMVGARVSGIPRCAWSLALEMTRQAAEDRFVLLACDNPLADLAGRPNVEVVETHCPIYSVREQFRVPRLLRRIDPDVYHAMTYAAPVRQPCPTVMTIYDLIPMRFANEYALRHRIYYPLVVRRAARKAAHILTISECSKRDVVELLDVEQEKVSVVACGVDLVFLDGGPAWKGRARPYLLSLGNEKPHKDMAPALEAFEEIADRRDLDLVLVGDLSDRVRKRLEISPAASRVSTVRNLTDRRLAELYAGARVFLFPSRYEGFGLPPLEAMACGTPAVVYAAEAVVESCGEAARVVPMGDIAAMTGAVEEILDDPALEKRLIAAGRERAHRYTWEEAARQTLEVYRRVTA